MTPAPVYKHMTTLEVEMHEVTSWEIWPYFAPHHYMSDQLNKAARAFVATMPDGTPVGFSAMLPMPSGTVKNAWRESRTVILPDFQGLGLGARLSDWVGEKVIWDLFGAYYSRTVHPRLGEYRERSPAWIATTTNRKMVGPNSGARGEATDSSAARMDIKARIAYSHRYIGYPEPKGDDL